MCITGLEHVTGIMVDLEYLAVIMERLESKTEAKVKATTDKIEAKLDTAVSTG
jgi:hypothetical protein